MQVAFGGSNTAKKLQDKGIETDVASAGTLDRRRNPRDEFYVKLGAEKGYSLEGVSKFVGDMDVTKDIDESYIVFIFEEYHRMKVERFLKYHNWNRIMLFMDYCFGLKEDLDDPNYGPEALYRKVFDKIEEGCEIIASRIQQQ